MKCLAAVALMVVGISFPAFAQHGASHGGFSGHSASASHGSFHASAPSRSAASPRISGSRTFTMPRGNQRGVGGNTSARPPYTGSLRYRRPYVSHFRRVVPYGVSGWVAPGYLGYPGYGDLGTDDDAGNTSTQAYDAQPEPDQPGQDQSGPLNPYPPYPGPPQPIAAPASQEAVTLVFADGRPSEQIHNYMLTRTTLFVLDEHHRDVPLDQLDLAATAKVNHDAGIDFRLPVSPGQ
jgi:hypothetical protein